MNIDDRPTDQRPTDLRAHSHNNVTTLEDFKWP